MMDGAVVRRLPCGEVSLQVTEVGPAGGPPVVLLHGFPQTSHCWRHQAQALTAAGFRVVLPEQRGYDGSDKPQGLAAYRLDRLAGDVVGLLDALAIPRAHLVGHDWGGCVAWTVAALHPSRVQRLVTINGPHPRHMRRELLTNATQARRSWYMLLFQLPWVAEKIMLRPDFCARVLRGTARRKDAFDDATLAVYAEAIHQPGAATAMLSWYRAAARLALPFLPPVLARTMCIWGDGDVALGRALARPPERYARDVEVRHVRDSGHWVPEERPDLVNEHLLEFLRR